MINDFFKILRYDEVVSFGKAQRNRKVQEGHVNDFVNIIKNGKSRMELGDGNYLVFGPIPIIVNPVTDHIMDGQHKTEAFKKAHNKGIIDDNARILVAFWEIEDEELENQITIDLNSKTKNWTVSDYIESYSQYKEQYQLLKEFCKSHQLCKVFSKSGDEKLKYRYGAAIITGLGQQSNLKGGFFNFTLEQLMEADAIHNEMMEIRKKIGLPMFGNDIEPMAVEWHKQRKFISAKEIKSLPYIPASVKNCQFNNITDWRCAFAQLKDLAQKGSFQKSVA